MATVIWRFGDPDTKWMIGSGLLRWREDSMSTASVSISHLSTEYVIIPVNATVSGAVHNPTSDVVQFAFLANPSASPLITDWVIGSWDTSSNAFYPYLAQCLVGPAGSTTLGTGTYTIWLKITDNPEVPVFQAGTLYIT